MSNSFSNQQQHALVMGGSFAGLLTARVLSNHFAKVTIVEKDPVLHEPHSRKGQPQTRHLHGLLPSGLGILSHYFPSLTKEIEDHGANVIDFAQTMNWYAYGGFKKTFVMGIDGVSISRPLLEHLVRERVLALTNIQLLDGTVVKQITTSQDLQEVTGIVAEEKSSGRREILNADLIVDATGRGSHTPLWLKELGYGELQVNEIKINVVYTTCLYKRDPEDVRGKSWMLCSPQIPKEARFGAVFPIEGNRWMVTVGGWHGEHAPAEENGFLTFVKSLPNPNIYDIVSKSEPQSEFMTYNFPYSIRRYYERLKRFPLRYLVLGDAISSFNPIYGQGMSSACLQAVVLDKVLSENIDGEKMAKTYFKRIAKIIDNIWQIATGEDFRFPQTIGKRPLGINMVNKYITQVHRATIKDEIVCKAFLKVMALLEPPASLFQPGILWRVMVKS
jgi:2-polyprenyl-6-methoxyphenol hydroxylase-like FAD-dependent oxidoreductase